MKVAPLELSTAASDVDFGVQVTDFNSEVDFDQLKELVFEKLVVVVRDQANLSPRDQYLLTKKFDPESEVYGHGNDKKSISLMEKSILQSDLVSIPATPQVKLLGNGRIENHEGIPEVVLKHPQHHTFHQNLVSEEDEAKGITRFYRWHMDAALYAVNPPRVTTLLALKVPEGRRQTIKYHDGTNDEIQDVCLSTTAFVSGESAFERLPAHQKEFALKTFVKYAPHPYIWIKNAKSRSNGLGIVSENQELPWDQLPPYKEELITILPMVWRNKETGKASLQIHPSCAQDLIVDGTPLNNLDQVRDILYDFMRPAISPNKVYTHEWRKGDLVIFSNQSLWHSVTGTLRADEERIFHQCNLVGSATPVAFSFAQTDRMK